MRHPISLRYCAPMIDPAVLARARRRAIYRVRLKRAIRRAGFPVARETPSYQLARLARRLEHLS